ncbi:MAG: DUF5615 family PIN-like protein [Armatimonadetes bacterium]|nr:DUF5615 family PIN-like protein [Armatimonadota bacterium]
MLALLTDAHISPDVAKRIRDKRPYIPIHSLREWRGGAFLNAGDEAILTAAQEEGLTFVTYDQRTISTLLVQWGAEGRNHAGVIFLSSRAIAQSDIGIQVHGIIALYDTEHAQGWSNRVEFLRPI